MATPNMGLVQNVIGITTDPTWSNNITGDFTIIDAHDHSSGNGVQVTPAGLNIISDLSFVFNNATNMRSWRMQPQSAVLATPSDAYCGYFVNGNFYINNAAGTPVQITNGTQINIAGAGGIGGDYISSGALVYYTNAISTYTFTTPAAQVAAISSGPITIQQPGAAFGTTLASPAGATGNSTITFFTAQPAAGAVTIDGAGQLTTTAITSGVYTPTLSAGTGNLNGGASAAVQHQYIRIGNIVTVSGFINFSGGTSGTSGTVRISLPVATNNFSAITQANGGVDWTNGGGSIVLTGQITSIIGAQTVLLTASTTSSTSGPGAAYTFSYQIQ